MHALSRATVFQFPHFLAYERIRDEKQHEKRCIAKGAVGVRTDGKMGLEMYFQVEFSLRCVLKT